MTASVPLACHDVKSCCTSFQSSWCSKCSGAIENAISVTCCLYQCLWQHMTKKSCCTSFQSFWHKEWNGAIDDSISIMWQWYQCQWHSMTVVPHFNCLVLRTKISFSMPLAPCDASTGANAITCTESCFASFSSLWPYKCSDAIGNTNGILKICLDMPRHIKVCLAIV